MKKLLCISLFFIFAGRAYAQSEPKAYLYGIQDTSLALTTFIDSLDKASPMNFLQIPNAVVRGCTIVFGPVNPAGVPERTGYAEMVTGRRISNSLKAALKSAQSGDFVYISNV